MSSYGKLENFSPESVYNPKNKLALHKTREKLKTADRIVLAEQSDLVFCSEYNAARDKVGKA